MMSTLMALLVALLAGDPMPDLLQTELFEAPKYGVTTRIPKAWPVEVHEEADRVFVAIIPHQDFDRPGVAACELGVAPESLEEYRTRIDTNARRNGRPAHGLSPDTERQVLASLGG